MFIDPGHVAGEASGYSDPASTDRCCRVDAVRRPRDRCVDGDCGRFDGVEIVNEAREQPVCLVKVVTEQAPQLQIFDSSVSELTHSAAPGHC